MSCATALFMGLIDDGRWPQDSDFLTNGFFCLLKDIELSNSLIEFLRKLLTYFWTEIIRCSNSCMCMIFCVSQNPSNSKIPNFYQVVAGQKYVLCLQI